MPDALPDLPEGETADHLDPDMFYVRPAVNRENLTLESVRPMREWIDTLTTPPGERSGDAASSAFYFDLSEDVSMVEQSVETLVDDYRRQGIDLYDRRDLLSAAWTLQAAIIGCMAGLDTCPAPLNDRLHSYTHFAMPMSNLAIGMELLILAVFGEEASLLEGGE